MGSGTFLRLKRPTGGAFEATFSVVLELVLLRGKKAFQATPTKLLRVPFKIFDEYHPFFFIWEHSRTSELLLFDHSKIENVPSQMVSCRQSQGL